MRKTFQTVLRSCVVLDNTHCQFMLRHLCRITVCVTVPKGVNMSVIAKEIVVWMLICQLPTHSAKIKITRAP